MRFAMKIIFRLIFLVFSVHVLAVEPSFNCTKSKTKVEKLICRDDSFATYDMLLSLTYNKHKSLEAFKDRYLAWIKERNTCNEAKEDIYGCLLDKYVHIISYIFNSVGFGSDFVPPAHCYYPLVPHMNGDAGFYAVRVMGRGRSCGPRLNLNVERYPESAKVTFKKQVNNIHTFEFNENNPSGVTRYDISQIHVKFHAATIEYDGRSETNLIMSLVA